KLARSASEGLRWRFRLVGRCDNMNGFTKLFLLILRLAIGWHLLFEAAVKVRTHELGKTTTNTPFSSAPYLRESSGPFADLFRKQAGDSDEEALAKLEFR